MSYFLSDSTPRPARNGPAAAGRNTASSDLPPINSFSPRRAQNYRQQQDEPARPSMAPPSFVPNRAGSPPAPTMPQHPDATQYHPSSVPRAAPASGSPFPSSPLSDDAAFLAQSGRMEAKWADTRRMIWYTAMLYTFSFTFHLFVYPLLPGWVQSPLQYIIPYTTMIVTGLTVIKAAGFGWEFYVRPIGFDKVADEVAKLTPEQRKLFNLDPRISDLVDSVHPRASGKPTPTIPLQSMPVAGPAVRRNLTRVLLRPTPQAPTSDAYVSSTADLRYANANSIFRGDRTTTETASPAPLVGVAPLNIPVKPIFQTYQQSAMPTAEEQKIAGSDQLTLVGAEETLRTFGVHPDVLSLWVENLRDWLSTKVFVPLVNDMVKVEQYLDSKGWSHLSLRNQVQAVDLPPAQPAGPQGFGQPFGATNTTTTGMFGRTTLPKPGFGGGFGATLGQPAAPAGPPTSLNGLAQHAAAEPLARLRIQLERYLFMPQYPATARGYIMRRILELARGSALAPFVWNSGGTQDDGKPWTPTVMPTDSELVMHVFATWIDLQMPGSSNVVTFAPFSTKYLRWTVDEKKDVLPKEWTLVMTSKSPPHFKLGTEKTLYDVYPKRNNMFATLALFTYKAQHEYSGYIDMLDIGGKVIGLTDILTDYY
ncbi:cytochrome B561, N terminal-domain-containing protein [Catenaria anguillulae PL171]|uniref:Cytochrome B561, N terminal-domain-containing protein n=1 Tax=Catenaria anguillulae PL171 TaxID=765915 RepID=A0A1Y2I0V6_9FUNG|nr:cytochrome B561, N terminal-domain-containing protein [Catenaria anguillulae PL171]